MTANKMKIAVPTDDGVLITNQFKGSRAFLVSTVKEGKITRQELRWNLLSEMMTSKHGYFYNLCDCNTVLVSNIGEGHTALLEARKMVVLRTDKTLISEILSSYLKIKPTLADVI
jgi:predicted Fe-Mo cluster-binding NifX family protein